MDNSKLSINNKNKFFEACEEFYYKKTLGRLKNYYLRFECSDEHNIINDRYVSKVSELLNQIDFKWLSKGIPAVFHVIYSLIIFFYKSKRI